jgi:endonuclease/exonuclease/phosphatase family metal-dependent hydrolase
MSRNQPWPTFTLANMNIERSTHLKRVSSFLTAHAPDVICLQEFMVDDAIEIGRWIGYPHFIFEAMGRYPGQGRYGLAIFSRFPIRTSEAIAYAGSGSGKELLDTSSVDSRMRTVRHVVLLACLTVGDTPFTIATTHFPWTPDGRANHYQRQACDSLLQALSSRPLVLCGDFNAPRGREIFARIASRWRDNVPQSYTSSIDPNLHRAGDLQLLVDGLFSTDDYRVTEVVLHEGISDHCALTARVAFAPARLMGARPKATTA